MKSRFTITKEQLKNSKVWEINKHQFESKQDEPRGKKIAKHFTSRSKEKDFIGWNLLYWCNQHAVVAEEEYRFDTSDEKRLFKFDWCIPSLKIAIEYEGLFSEKSGHTTPKGFTKDTTKYNLATSQGWKLIRLTALNYKTLVQELDRMYAMITNK